MGHREALARLGGVCWGRVVVKLPRGAPRSGAFICTMGWPAVGHGPEEPSCPAGWPGGCGLWEGLGAGPLEEGRAWPVFLGVWTLSLGSGEHERVLKQGVTDLGAADRGCCSLLGGGWGQADKSGSPARERGARACGGLLRGDPEPQPEARPGPPTPPLPADVCHEPRAGLCPHVLAVCGREPRLSAQCLRMRAPRSIRANSLVTFPILQCKMTPFYGRYQ